VYLLVFNQHIVTKHATFHSRTLVSLGRLLVYALNTNTSKVSIAEDHTNRPNPPIDQTQPASNNKS